MIGTYLNLDLPLLSDTMSTMVAKTATALGQLRDSIADKASPAGLTIVSDLSFGGNRATNLGGAVFTSGNNPTAAGSMYYSGGEFYLVDATGVIQVTSLGQLKASSFGGIGGDYGGSNPALVSYNTAAGEYRFYVNPGTPVWAGIATKYVLLEGTNGTVKVGVDNAITGNKTANFKSLPASGVSVLVYDAGDNGIKDGNATGPTNDLVSTANIKASILKFSTPIVINLPLELAASETATFGYTNGMRTSYTFAGDTKDISFPLALPEGAQIADYGVNVNNSGGTNGTVHVEVVSTQPATGASGAITITSEDAGNSGGYTSTTVNAGFSAWTTPTSAPDFSSAIISGHLKQYHLRVKKTTGTDNFNVRGAYVAYTVP